MRKSRSLSVTAALWQVLSPWFHVPVMWALQAQSERRAMAERAFSLTEQDMKKTRRKRRPGAQGEGPSPHLQDFSPLLCAFDQAFPQEHVVWMKQWPETRGRGCPCHCTALVQPDFGSPKPLGANESFHRDNNGQNNQPSLDNFFD